MSRKKHVTFKEPPKPSPRVTKKPVATQIKKSNIAVHLSTGIKSATGASKTAFKNYAWIYRKLPAKSTSGEKVEDHPRNLNKQNRVDSHLNAKRLVSISNLNAVCGACHECLFSFNHDKWHPITGHVYVIAEKFIGTVRFGNGDFAKIVGYCDYKLVCLLTKASSTKSWLWHRRLNRLNFGTLNELA
nr:integrase, catalytic region, zinc finger, CCHC-type, peptidase aspartic, catalytic [Tanacetum cinerariifolium]